MTQGIWAVWYDLPGDDSVRESYMDWFHGAHLPGLLSRPEFVWAAHYRIVGGGARMEKIHDRLARPDDPDLGAGTQFLALVGATSPHVFFDPKIVDIESELSTEAPAMLALRQGSRSCFFTEEAEITGPASGSRSKDSAPAPAIQMGSFRTKTVADEFDLAAWYAQYRLPAMSRMPGCVATRKLVSLAAGRNTRFFTNSRPWRPGNGIFRAMNRWLWTKRSGPARSSDTPYTHRDRRAWDTGCGRK